jgi:flavin reductase (DIM6/NTAB) family NADH-FMN oxidoreductase RutF
VSQTSGPVTSPQDPAPASAPGHPTQALAPEAFRLAVGQFVSGIAVVATTVGGVTSAITASSFTSVSLDPLLVLVCVERAGRQHDPVVSAGTWAVSVLAEDHEPTARGLAPHAQLPGSTVAGLNGHPHHPGPATGHPILDGALAALECRTYAVHPGGDHTILIGQVLSVAGPAATKVPGPLLTHAGRYRRLRTR